MTFLQVCSTASSIWLSYWSDMEDQFPRDFSIANDTISTEAFEDMNLNMTATGETYVNDDRMFYLGIYGLFGIGQAVTAVFGSLLLYLSTLNGSRT